MAATDTVMAALESNWEMVDRALDGLDETTMSLRKMNTVTPSPGLFGT